MNASFQGVIIDSTSTPLESLDAPSRRSTKTMGTSAIVRPAARRLKGHLDQERVAIRRNRVERDLRERLPPPAAVAAGAVAHAQARRRPDVRIGERAQHLAPQRPVLDAAAFAISRPDHQPASRLCRGHQRRQELGIVREVGVHLAHEVGIALDRPRESRRDTSVRGRAPPGDASRTGVRDGPRRVDPRARRFHPASRRR